MSTILAPAMLAQLDETDLKVIAMVIGCVLIYSLIHAVRRVSEHKATEATRREIAAYVAEGTIKPEDAARLLSAGADERGRMLAQAVEWGRITPERAAELMEGSKKARAEA